MASPPSDIVAGSHMNGHRLDDEHGHVSKPSLGFSDYDGEENEDNDNARDYSTRMEELFEGEKDASDDDDGEGFIYTGVDADNSIGDYRSQLRDVLGPEEEHTEELEVARSLLQEVANQKVVFNIDESIVVCITRVIYANL